MCDACNNTGSLSKEIGGFLDCTKCDIATQRVQLEGWLTHMEINIAPAEAWLIYNHGCCAGLRRAAEEIAGALA